MSAEAAEDQVRDVLAPPAPAAADLLSWRYRRKDPTGDSGDFVQIAGLVDLNDEHGHPESFLNIRPISHEVPDGWPSLVVAVTPEDLTDEYRRATADELAEFALAELERARAADEEPRDPTPREQFEESVAKLTAAAAAITAAAERLAA